MTVAIARVAAVLALVLAIALGVQTWRLRRAADRETAAHVAAQDAALVAADWQRAAEGSQRDLARIVPELRAQLDAAKKAGTITAGTSHWTGHGAEVAVPCTVVMGPPAGATDAAPPGPPPVGLPGASPVVAVTPHVRIDDAVALDDGGGIFVARRVQARLAVGTAWASSWEPVEADPGSTTAVAPEIEAAWRAYRNPPPRLAFVRGPKLWRTGLACGVGLGYGVTRGGADVVAACIWGAQF